MMLMMMIFSVIIIIIIIVHAVTKVTFLQGVLQGHGTKINIVHAYIDLAWPSNTDFNGIHCGSGKMS